MSTARAAFGPHPAPQAQASPQSGPQVERGGEARARRRDEAHRLVAHRAACGAALIDAIGIQAAANALGVSEDVVARLAAGTSARRRRLHALLCERLGLSESEALETASSLPPEPILVARAAFHFGVALEIAGTARVLGRAEHDRLTRAYGAEALAFALEMRARLRGSPDAGSGAAPAEVIAARAPTLLVATLAAHGHPAAGPVGAVLSSLPVTPSSEAAEQAADPQRLDVALEALARARAHGLAERSASAAEEAAPAEPAADATDEDAASVDRHATRAASA